MAPANAAGTPDVRTVAADEPVEATLTPVGGAGATAGAEHGRVASRPLAPLAPIFDRVARTGPVARAPMTFTVNSVGDGGDTAPGNGQCRDSGGQCTLRAAIEEANANAGSDTIAFGIGSGPRTISPGFPLPQIFDPVTIDATTQPGSAGAPIIELNGSLAGSSAVGLWITAGNSAIEGLVINRWDNIGLFLQNGGDNTVKRNWIGTTANGLGRAGNGNDGINVINSPRNLLGGPAGERNVVAANGDFGISITGSASTGNVLRGNFIGTDATGTASLGNGGGVVTGKGTLNGVDIGTAADTVIGEGSPGAGNVISGNARQGVSILDAPRTQIRGNLIGLGVGGEAIGNGEEGIEVESAADTVIGGTGAGDRNVISANGKAVFPPKDGILVFGPATGTKILGNNLGTTPAGDAITAPGGAPTGNGRFGLALSTRDDLTAATNSTVGGRTAPERNVIAGNDFGVGLLGKARRNTVEGNLIGTDRLGRTDLGNASHGIYVLQADDNQIGGVSTGARNLIAGNGGSGVQIEDSANVNYVQGNDIGAPFANDGDGVAIVGGASQNVVGHDISISDSACLAGPCNKVVDNAGAGIYIEGAATARNTVRGNRITQNDGLGIDLAPRGVTANDTGDGDSGPNALMNFPVGVTAYRDVVSGMTSISGVLDTADPSAAVVDLYGDTQRDASGFGEGATFIGSVRPKPNGSFSVEAKSTHRFYSATGTARGSTSEFSPVCGDPDANGSTDNDKDALCDDWEAAGGGVDYNGDRTVDLALSATPFNADPNRKDIFLEVDWMEAFFHDHKPEPGALTDTAGAFLGAPGAPIHLHTLLDEDIGHVDSVTFPGSPGGSDDFYDLKNGGPATPCDGHFGTAADRANAATCANVLGAKRLVFRYGIFGHDIAACPRCIGEAEGAGNDLIIALGGLSDADFTTFGGASTCAAATPPTCRRRVEAIDLMHELGHTLGLGHGGGDAVNYKPNYLSVMNYSLSTYAQVSAHPLDYSRWDLPDLNEPALREGDGIDAGAPPPGLSAWRTPFTYFQSGLGECSFAVRPAIGAIDWNVNGIIDPVAVRAGINDPPRAVDPPDPTHCTKPSTTAETLQSFDDWASLHFNIRDTIGFSDANVPGLVPPELTEDEYRELAEITDEDEDGVTNAADNCIAVANAGQEDADEDAIGDACDPDFVPGPPGPPGPPPGPEAPPGSPAPPDGPTAGELRIADQKGKEKDRGRKTFVFNVTLSQAARQEVRVSFKTKNGNAKAGRDYKTRKGTLTFGPGETVGTIKVKVFGDTEDERKEKFVVQLENAVGATIADGKATGVVKNDD